MMHRGQAARSRPQPVAQFTAGQRAEIDQAVRVMALACLLVIMVVAAGGYLAMGRALRPLRAVTETARAIEETDLSRRIEVWLG